ncbi:hypothetical protein [Microcoleus sp. B9-D4]|uniref:hypothetical protein n=1 Tax=Microcoleus sp. B9-D4 TaxID=2818711 RepID=UPI002FD68CC4
MKKQRDGNTADFNNGSQSTNSLVTSSDARENVSVNPSKSTDTKLAQYGGQGEGNNGETEQDRRNADGSGEADRPGDQGVMLGSLFCGAVPALVVGFGAFCYHTGYQQGGKEARPTIVHGNQYNSKTYHISPSIGSNNSNNSHK